jgi:regulatory protein YycI of two-component signal transduction system YycFG
VTENRLIAPKSVVKRSKLCYNKNGDRREKEKASMQEKGGKEKKYFLRFTDKENKEIYFEQTNENHPYGDRGGRDSDPRIRRI